MEMEVGSTTADITVLAAPFPDHRTSKKTTYTDNSTKQGMRYYYRVRWVNAHGAGEWSDIAVSGVQ